MANAIDWLLLLVNNAQSCSNSKQQLCPLTAPWPSPKLTINAIRRFSFLVQAYSVIQLAALRAFDQKIAEVAFFLGALLSSTSKVAERFDVSSFVTASALATVSFAFKHASPRATGCRLDSRSVWHPHGIAPLMARSLLSQMEWCICSHLRIMRDASLQAQMPSQSTKNLASQLLTVCGARGTCHGRFQSVCSSARSARSSFPQLCSCMPPVSC
jgi:hypothetical protein